MSDPRTAPQDIDAEKSVIGAILIENEGYDQIASWLEPSHFFRKVHRDIFAAMAALLTNGKPADLRMLCEELARVKLLDEVGGPAYVASLTDGVPRSTNVKYYAGIVREKAALRRLIKIGSTLADRAYDAAEGPQALIAQTDLALTSLATDAKWSTGAVPLADGLGALSAELAHRIERRGQIVGVSSGLPTLDLLTHGWQPRKMIVVAAQTSFGKSVFALDQARAFASAGQRVVYYSFEMPKEDLHWRLLSSLSEIPLTQMGWGNIRTDGEFEKLATAQEVMADLPIEFNDSSSRSILDIRAECRQIKADRGLGAIFIDHFQLMDGTDGENRVQQLANISRRIQSLAQELSVPVFVLSQLTMGGDRDANREPHLDDLRECKSLGHDCDIALFLHPYKPAEARTDVSVLPMKLLVRKHRGGRLGTVPLHLERDYVRFIEGEAPAPTPKKAKTKELEPEPLRY